MDNNYVIEKDHLEEALNRTQRELSVLYEVSNAMRTTLELNRILYIILTGVTSHSGLGFNRAILFLVNKNTRNLEPKLAIGPESGEHAQEIWGYISESKQHLEDLIKDDKMIQNGSGHSSLFNAIKHLRIPLDQKDNLLGSAFHQGIPLRVPYERIIQCPQDPLLQVFKTTELVVMPLKAKDKVNGLIVADNLFTKKPITEQDLKIFTMLANQAGLAIENSQLYELIIHKSHTDSVTGLWNHGFFQNQLSKEVEVAKESKQPLSLLILDIDNFKQLNDTYGHQTGDLILKELALILKNSSREIDYVCRYGGEEFSIILTQTSKDRSLAIAERIRQKIEQTPFPRLQSEDKLKVTVSIGIATLPQDTLTKEELITLADKAMYIAKFSGKNQTCSA
jgi:diguanylate cyclase (GGDEF)-like protein